MRLRRTIVQRESLLDIRVGVPSAVSSKKEMPGGAATSKESTRGVFASSVAEEVTPSGNFTVIERVCSGIRVNSTCEFTGVRTGFNNSIRISVADVDQETSSPEATSLLCQPRLGVARI